MFVLHKFGADLSGYFIHCFLSRRVTGEPCVHVRSDWELIDVWNIKIRAVNRVFVMDPEILVEALRGTMDPNLREAAERQLNEVKVEISRKWWWRLWRGLGSGLGRSQHQDGAITQTVTLTDQELNITTRHVYCFFPPHSCHYYRSISINSITFFFISMTHSFASNQR